MQYGGRTWASIWFLVAAACASPDVPPPDPSPDGAQDQLERSALEEGERALTLGHPVKAVLVLSRIQDGDSAFTYAQQLLKIARRDVDEIIRNWLDEIDLLILTHEFGAARARCNYLLGEFPLTSSEKKEVGQRIELVDEGIDDARRVIDDARDQAHDFLMTDDLNGALRTLRGARALVWEVDPNRALGWERVLAAVTLRKQKEDALTVEEELDKDKPVASNGRRRVIRRRRKPAPAAATPVVESSEPVLSAKQVKLRALLRQADTHRERKDFFSAIQSYSAVLKVDKDSAEAQQALLELKRERSQLVGDYLAKAQQHFLQQNLSAAAPYYKRVLLLDPGNEEAGDGLRMFKNLEKIRKQGGR